MPQPNETSAAIKMLPFFIFLIGLIGSALASEASKIIRDASFSEFMEELLNKLQDLQESADQIKDMEDYSNDFIKKVVYDFGPKAYKAFYDADQNLQGKYFIWNETLQTWHLPNQNPGPQVHGSNINAIILGKQIQSLYAGFIHQGASNIDRRMNPITSLCGDFCGVFIFHGAQSKTSPAAAKLLDEASPKVTRGSKAPPTPPPAAFNPDHALVEAIDDIALNDIQIAYVKARIRQKKLMKQMKKFDPTESRKSSIVDLDGYDSDSTKITSNKRVRATPSNLNLQKREWRQLSSPANARQALSSITDLKETYMMKAASILNNDWMIVILDRFFQDLNK